MWRDAEPVQPVRPERLVDHDGHGNLHAGLLVTVVAAVLGVAAIALRIRSRVTEAVDVSSEAEVEQEAA